MRGSLGHLWVALGGLCAGVAYGFGSAVPAVPVVVAAGTVLVLVRRRPSVAAVGLACIAFTLGAFDSRSRIERGALLEAAARAAPRCTFQIRALEEEGGLGSLVAIDRLSCATTTLPPRPGLAWIDDALAPGSLIEGEGWLAPLGDDGFGRARRRFGAGAELVVLSSTETPPHGGLAGAAAEVRAGLDSATRGMPADRAGLLKGVTTGDTSSFDESVTEDFRTAGLSHLVAVSGQNVAMVVGAIALLTRTMTARLRTALAVSAVALFVVVVGPQPSVLRAAAMTLIALAALGLGARADAWHLFAVALIAVVALRPAVLYSAGLHLSAAATAGLLLWARVFFSRLARLPAWVALGLATTLSAQLAVMPLIVGLFGSLSLAAPLANVLGATCGATRNDPRVVRRDDGCVQPGGGPRSRVAGRAVRCMDPVRGAPLRRRGLVCGRAPGLGGLASGKPRPDGRDCNDAVVAPRR